MSNMTITFPEKGRALITDYLGEVEIHRDFKEGITRINTDNVFLYVGMDLNDYLMTLEQFLNSPSQRIIRALDHTLEGIEVKYEQVDRKKKK